MSTATATPKKIGPSLAVPSVMNRHPLEVIANQRRQIQHRDYMPFGQLARINLGEDCLPNSAPDNPLVGSWTSRNKPMAPALDWKNVGPLIGVSKDQQDLLVIGRTLHPPPLVDPNWQRTRDPIYAPGKPPDLEPPHMIEQSLLDRAWMPPEVKWARAGKRYKPQGPWFFAGEDNEQWMIFQPVWDLIIYNPGMSGVTVVQFHDRFGSVLTDNDGRVSMFVYDRKREEGHLLFGRFELEGHKA